MIFNVFYGIEAFLRGDYLPQFSLGTDGSITGLKTPKVEKSDGDDPDAALLEKLYLLGQVVGVLREVTTG